MKLAFCAKKLEQGVLNGEYVFDEAEFFEYRKYPRGEELKKEIGSAYPTQLTQKTAEIKGRDLVTGLPKTVEISADKVNEAITEQIEDIIAAIKEVLEKTPPELASDIMNRGIVMTGGGSLLHGLDTLVSERTGLPTYIPEDAISCVAIGTGLALQNIDVLKGAKKHELI